MPCYEQGRFYQQQMQAVGFYGGSEACAASVGARGTDPQSFLLFEVLGVWPWVTSAAGSWGFNILAASPLGGIFQSKQLLGSWV